MNIIYLVCLVALSLILIGLFLNIIISYSNFHRIFSRKGKIKKQFEKKNQVEIDEDEFKKMEHIFVTSFDGTKLSAYYKDNANSQIVLFVHGYGQTKKNLLPWGKLFQTLGYDQLYIDMRGSGESEGDEISFGENAEKDIEKWLDKICEMKSDYKIILFGLGLGGSAIINSSKNNRNVKAVILDSCFDNALKQMLFLNSKKKIKSKIINKMFLNYLKRNKNLNLKNIDNCEKLKEVNLPVLILHGENDDITPVEMAYNLYAALPEKTREINIFKNTNHLEGINSDKFLYKSIIRKFLTKFVN